MTAAMVLCAGLGTRLRPLTDELAKPLMPLGDRPVLAHALDAIEAAGLGPVAINTHARASDFDLFFRERRSGARVSHEPDILGTAGGLWQARDALGAGPVVVWNGDIVASGIDLARLVGRHAASGADATWLVSPRPRGRGTVGLDAEGRIVRLRDRTFGVEVAGADYVGVQVVGERLRATLPERGCLVADVAVPLLGRGGTIATALHDGAWIDVGTPAGLLGANVAWLRRRGAGKAWIGAGATVAADAVLVDAIVGPAARVEGAGVVSRAVVFPRAAARAPLAGAIVGRTATVLAETC